MTYIDVCEGKCLLSFCRSRCLYSNERFQDRTRNSTWAYIVNMKSSCPNAISVNPEIEFAMPVPRSYFFNSLIINMHKCTHISIHKKLFSKTQSMNLALALQTNGAYRVLEKSSSYVNHVHIKLIVVAAAVVVVVNAECS